MVERALEVNDERGEGTPERKIWGRLQIANTLADQVMEEKHSAETILDRSAIVDRALFLGDENVSLICPETSIVKEAHDLIVGCWRKVADAYISSVTDIASSLANDMRDRSMYVKRATAHLHACL